MTTIYALMICLTMNGHDLGCSPPENGWMVFQSAEDCQQVANKTNNNQAGTFRDAKNFVRERCFQRDVNRWTPIEDEDANPG